MTKSRFQGISLDSFLQMIQMDKTSCTLRVESRSGSGVMYIVNGELVDAECEDLSGSDAAFEIVSWRDISFEFENICDDRIRKINMPLMHLLMEGLKKRDDRDAGLIPEAPAKPVQPEPVKKNDPVDLPDIPVLGIPAMDVFKEPLPQYEDNFVPGSASEGAISFKTIQKKPPAPVIKFSMSIVIGAVTTFVVVLVVIAAVIMFGGKSDEHKYLKAFDQVAKTPDFPDKINIIQKYLDDNKESEYFQKASERLVQIKKEKAEKEFMSLDQRIKNLPIDKKFVPEAQKILSAYSKANPESTYNDEVAEKLNKLPDIYEAAVFEKASVSLKGDPEIQAEALSAYLAEFPGSKNYEAAKILYMDVEQKLFDNLVAMSGQCIEKNDFSPCVIKIESYRRIFGKDSRKYDVENLMANMEGGRNLITLRKNAAALGDDLEAKRDLYNEYLRNNRHDTDSRRQARQESDEIERLIADRKDWESSRSYATSNSYPIKERARRLESFIARNPKSAYVPDAKNLLASMGSARSSSESPSAPISDPQASRKSLTDEQPSVVRSTSSSVDFAREWSLIEKASGNRFRNNGNGTFTDTMTGKIWCIVDSRKDAGRCLNYRDAQEYVKGLAFGGYGDWRMPTASELFAVYKNSPALPDTGSSWYWTSDALWRGVNEIVRIVRPGIEHEITNETVAISDCGYVRAVRN